MRACLSRRAAQTGGRVNRQSYVSGVALAFLGLLALSSWVAVGALPSYRQRQSEVPLSVGQSMPVASLEIGTHSGHILAAGHAISALRTFVLDSALEVFVRPHSAAYRGLAALTPQDGTSGGPALLRLDGKVIATGIIGRDYNIGDDMAGPWPGNTGFFYQGPRYFALYESLTGGRPAAHNRVILSAALSCIVMSLAGYLAAIGFLARWHVWSRVFVPSLVAGVLIPWIVAFVHVAHLPGMEPTGVAALGGAASVVTALIVAALVGLLRAGRAPRGCSA